MTGAREQAGVAGAAGAMKGATAGEPADPIEGAARAGSLWLLARPGELGPGEIGLVLDPTWTRPAEAPPGLLAIRDISDEVLRAFDPIEETSLLLDAWAADSGVIPALTVGETSWWYYLRLRTWLWLQERVLWAVILRRVVDTTRPTAIACAAGTDAGVALVASLLAAQMGLAFREPPDTAGAGGAAESTTPPSGARRPTANQRPRPRRPLPLRVAGRVLRIARRVVARGRTEAPAPPRLATLGGETIEARVARLAQQAGRPLLVVSTHLPQRVETSTGPRYLNPYLGAIVDRLRGSAFAPIVLDRHPRKAGETQTSGPTGPGADRVLSSPALRVAEPAEDPAAREAALAAAQAIAGSRSPMLAAGIDLGPDLARHVAEDAITWFPGIPHAVDRVVALAERLHVRGFLVADEYHRQDCLEAGRRLGLPVAAVQHGTIYRRHNGYIHGARPAQLRLPDRTYVFGRWERELLLRESVYRPDEVVVGGSPRQDLFRPATVDREAVRAELGVRPGERLLVLSGTYGAIYRRFHYPVVLARLFDRPMPGVRLVVKLHPAETDEGPYRAVIEGVAAAHGFEPVPIHVVQHVDLYRLLQSADAHLGIHSTVLTEAVFVGTRNLLASGVKGGDLLDYVAAGVATPVTTGEDLLTALEADGGTGPGSAAADARRAFLDQHYEPGSGSERIAGDLLAWLA